MNITRILARQILDSRGTPTVEADVYVGDIFGRASVPSGKSTGSHEALELRDGAKEYGGKSVQKAVNNILTAIAPRLGGMAVENQAEIDRALRALDGTPDKSILGANAILAVSLAAARAAAAAQNIPLWQYIRNLSNITPKSNHTLRLVMNVINGGQHAGNNLTLQEYQIIPKGASIKDSLRLGVEMYHALGKTLAERYGKSAVNVGDEGGYAPNLKNSLEPFEIMTKVAIAKKWIGNFEFGTDAAATNFFANNHYTIDNTTLNTKDLLQLYGEITSAYPFALIEDPFAETDLNGFKLITKNFPDTPLIVGDDLTVSDSARVNEAAAEKAVSAIILKVNQIGTLTEAMEAAKAARQHHCKVIVSHRSGETEDTFISHLAWGIQAWGIKAGAPARGERTAKYNELLRIEEQIRPTY